MGLEGYTGLEGAESSLFREVPRVLGAAKDAMPPAKRQKTSSVEQQQCKKAEHHCMPWIAICVETLSPKPNVAVPEVSLSEAWCDWIDWYGARTGQTLTRHFKGSEQYDRCHKIYRCIRDIERQGEGANISVTYWSEDFRTQGLHACVGPRRNCRRCADDVEKKSMCSCVQQR